MKEEGVYFLYDSFTLKEFYEDSMYHIDFIQKFISLIKIPYLCFKDLYKLIIDSHKLFDFCTTAKILLYKFRLAHKVSFEFYLFNHLKNKNIVHYISSNKDDRYASTEKRLCKELKIHTIGILMDLNILTNCLMV